MKMSYEEWYKHQQNIIQQEYTEILIRIREKAQQSFNATVKESLAHVGKKK
ncbi:hypothetical protein BhaS171_00059 [Bacillus phage vB_BhaS-171]|uniref:hypothetical protein n=1 Tax=Bacillus phage vB_BhaS-171 TaxID=1775140 RepID=UPI000744D01C|nr:hypothetical protein BH781_gp59 [Bacillus phage vB_BhaS-171]ALY08115.1 hypothetical protein BhaS171_00059 [Bacillus phage vB_BhaS-171]